jgi:N-acetylmuramoyl-L-alanine amidase
MVLIVFLYNHYVLGIILSFRSHIARVTTTLIFISVFSLWPTASVTADEPVATNIRIGINSDTTRFVVDISDNVKFRIFALSDPYRIVVDLPEMAWRLPVDVIQRNLLRKRSLITNFRYGYFKPGLSRVVLDVESPTRIKSSFVIPPANGKKYRLVVDLVKTTRKLFLTSIKKEKLARSKKISTKKRSRSDLKRNRYSFSKGSAPVKRKKEKALQRSSKKGSKKPVIVIDPGHGGIDPG